MGYFDVEENVQRYIKMTANGDGNHLMAILSRYLPSGSSLLELGMGPGKDLKQLAARYRVTGSDNSRLFIEHYQKENPTADLLQLDACSIATERIFDALYSNKVLHQLSREELRQSLQRQRQVLCDAGIALHSFWRGKGREELHGECYQYYEVDELWELVQGFEVLQASTYGEIESNDSIYLLLRKSR